MKKFELTLSAILVPLDAVLLFFAGMTAYGLRFTETATGIRRVMFFLPVHDFVKTLVLVVPMWILIFAANGLYTIDANRKFASDLSRVFFSCTVGLAAITVFIFFRGEFFNSRFIVLAAWLLAIVFIVIGRIAMRIIKVLFYRAGIGTRHLVLLGSGPITDRLAHVLQMQKSLGYTTIARYPIFNEKVRSEILELDHLHGVDELLISNPKESREETLTVLTFAEAHHFTLKYSADLFSTLAPHMRVAAIADVPIIEFRRARLDGWGKILKRSFDLCTSIVFLIITLPLTLSAALAIYFETGRPIFFKNTRVGYHGHAFKTVKFRSMFQKFCTEGDQGIKRDALKLEDELIKKQNAKHAGPIYKVADDPRVTRVGKFLRRWSVDELPQLWNVFVGTMSLVGPRPHQPREVAKYSPEDRRVHVVKPGMTGLAQISGRSDLPFDDEIRLDMFYVENWSLIMDLFILLKTPWAVIRKRSVE